MIRILECWVWITTVIKGISHALMRFCKDGYEPFVHLLQRNLRDLCSSWFKLALTWNCPTCAIDFICFTCCLISSFTSHLMTVAEWVSEGFCFHTRNKARQTVQYNEYLRFITRKVLNCLVLPLTCSRRCFTVDFLWCSGLVVKRLKHSDPIFTTSYNNQRRRAMHIEALRATIVAGEKLCVLHKLSVCL